ncbi:MAG: hypothetical protein LBV16_09350 [Elusimicrobiota bacterium]|jgi:hypothetical protein|nr:hypothetical protein [Elusimicrobiota bacterium]
MKIKISDPLISQRDLEPYIVEVGILEAQAMQRENKPASIKKKGIKGKSGQLPGPLRYTSGKSKTTIGQLANILDAKYKILEKAQNNPNNKDLQDIADKLIGALYRPNASSLKRYLNACLALVRNPIMRGEFPSNAPSTIKQKGFNRPLIDTGKFFNSIKARFLNPPKESK